MVLNVVVLFWKAADKVDHFIVAFTIGTPEQEALVFAHASLVLPL